MNARNPENEVNVTAEYSNARQADAVRILATLAAPHQELIRAVHNAGHTIYLVGGPVRDALLGRASYDLDFTTSATPDVILPIMQEYCSVVWEAGLEFGTVSGEHQGEQIEITTFRSDAYDRVSRNPIVTFGDNLADDLVRRDFRCNAVAAELLPDGAVVLHDPCDGVRDVLDGVIQTPTDPEISFGDDPLRMLRAARFVSQLGFSLADYVEQSMRTMSGEIARIKVERVQAELDKLMGGIAPWEGVDVLVRTGLADVVLPELSALQMEPDEHLQHKDVYAHSLTVLRQAVELEQTEQPDLVLRYAALLHDIGKPDTRAAKPGGGVTFHQHEVVGAKLARKRLRALKFSKQMVKDISQLIFLHMRFYGYGEGAWTDSAVRRYVTDAGEQLDQLNTLVRADCTTRNQRKARRLQRACDDLQERIKEIAEKEDLAKVRPALSGNEIMQLLDIPAGPVVGEAWTMLKELRLERGVMEREEAVEILMQWWAEHER